MIDADRLARVTTLQAGAHASAEVGICAMEAVGYIAGEPWSDEPRCACPVIAAFLRSWNDSLQSKRRDAILIPLIPRVVGPRDPALETPRALMAADWLVRSQTAAWLRLVDEERSATALATLPEITALDQLPALRDRVETIGVEIDYLRMRRWATAAPAGDRPSAAAMETANEIARSAANAAGAQAARAAALNAEGVGAHAEILNAAWYIARSAAFAAIAARAHAALERKRTEVQRSALTLVGRMIEARP